MKNTQVKTELKIKLDHTPHFKLEGRFAFDSGDEEQVFMLKTKQYVKATYRFVNLHLQEAYERDFNICLKSECSPYDVMRKAYNLFLQLSYISKDR